MAPQAAHRNSRGTRVRAAAGQEAAKQRSYCQKQPGPQSRNILPSPAGPRLKTRPYGPCFAGLGRRGSPALARGMVRCPMAETPSLLDSLSHGPASRRAPMPMADAGRHNGRDRHERTRADENLSPTQGSHPSRCLPSSGCNPTRAVAMTSMLVAPKVMARGWG